MEQPLRTEQRIQMCQNGERSFHYWERKMTIQHTSYQHWNMLVTLGIVSQGMYHRLCDDNLFKMIIQK